MSLELRVEVGSDRERVRQKREQPKKFTHFHIGHKCITSLNLPKKNIYLQTQPASKTGYFLKTLLFACCTDDKRLIVFQASSSL